MAPIWDEAKRVANLRKHGLDFADVEAFEWDGATIEPDDRRDYGEMRYIATGMIGSRLHILVFTMRDDELRPISLRRANAREARKYEKKH